MVMPPHLATSTQLDRTLLITR